MITDNGLGLMMLHAVAEGKRMMKQIDRQKVTQIDKDSWLMLSDVNVTVLDV